MPNRNDHLRLAYGITDKHYQWLLDCQGGVCAICKSSEGGGRHKNLFYVDHDHVTGKVRGLLCINCNLGLGKFADSPDRLKAALSYVERAGFSQELEAAAIPAPKLEKKTRPSVNYARKLDWAKVEFIRRALSAGTHSQEQLALLLSVSQAMVSRVALNKVWNVR